jgi:uncharacterized protein (DUF1330 family)
MAGYVIAQVEVTDPAGFAEYRQLVGPTVEQYGGSYVVRGGATETVEGDWQPQRLVILRFDSVAQAREWYYSPEYEGPKALRQRSAKSQVTFVEGM